MIMKDVRLPKGANITVSRDDYRRATGGSGVGWGIAVIIFLAVAFGSTDGEDTPNNKPANPTPSATATR